MNILGIDTSTKHMSIAIVSEDLIIGELIFNSNMDHSEKLISNISYILESNDMSMKDIDLIGVAKGPGSFTGIRIGIATVKGLAEFSEIPVVGVSSLEVLASNFKLNGRVAVAVDAKRDRVYGALYDFDNSKTKHIIAEGLYDLSEFKEKIKSLRPEIIAGDMNNRFEELEDIVKFSTGLMNLNHGANLCFIAKSEFENGNSIRHIKLDANYLTKSQAQMDMEKKNGKI